MRNKQEGSITKDSSAVLLSQEEAIQSAQVSNTNKKNEKIGFGKMFFWQSRAISLGCNMLIMGFLSIYCTDTLKMPAALVGTLLMASKLCDGLIDLLAGYLVDKTNTKIGRGRPYELCIIGVWIFTMLMFSCPPGLSIFVKSAWIFMMYVFANSIFATFLNVSNTVYMVRAFSRQEDYVAVSSYGSLIVILFVVAFNVSFPMAMAKLAISAGGWRALIAIYAIPLLLIGLLRFIMIKETNDVDSATSEKIRMKDVFTLLKTNHYIYVVAVMVFVFNFITNMGVGTYYYTYIVKNIALMGPIALTNIVVLPILFLFPPIIKKFSTTKLMIAGLFISCIGYVINFIALNNFGLLVLGSILVGAGNVPISMLSALMIIDCADYNEWNGRPRMEGTLGCVTGFTTKIGAALGTGVMGVLLGFSGYTGDISTQPDSALFMIRLLFSIIPIVLYAVVAFILTFYKLDNLIPQIRKDNEERRKQFLH
ncbi:MAG TPA: MFS transporter [Mobilitalea sp.]|nr:MFS transporter [Mobilitalea sp.]